MGATKRSYDEVTRFWDARLSQPAEQLDRSGTPEHFLLDLADDAVQQLLDDLVDLGVDAHVLTDVGPGGRRSLPTG